MAHRIVPSAASIRCDAQVAIEAHDIHMATCRARRQGLACSTCSELLERLISALRAAIAEAA